MKKYIGTKVIQAEPMTKGDAFKNNLLRNYSIREDEKEMPGYKVVYKDGYESWSPKEAFEEAYKVAETPLDRVEIERLELADKHNKLDNFIGTPTFEALDTVTKAMLIAQRDSMADYGKALALRSTRMESGDGGFTYLPFGVAISLLENGFAIQREGWNGKGLVVFKQVPAHITEETILKMQSLPEEAKRIILESKKHIDYTSQCLIYNTKTGRADSWVPSISDVFAKDWQLVTNF